MPIEVIHATQVAGKPNRSEKSVSRDVWNEDHLVRGNPNTVLVFDGDGDGSDVSYASLKTNMAFTKGDVGLGNVDNTSDANKPVSTAQQTALNLKANSADLSATTGAGLVGSNDSASGSLWTTIGGFISYLRSSAGSAILGFIASGTGAVARTIQDRLRDGVNIKDFGASPAASRAANKAAIQAALNSGAARVEIPAESAGTVYQIDGSLTIPTQCELVGTGHWTAVIDSNDVDSPILTSTGSNCAVRNLHLRYTGTPISGADAIAVTGGQTWSFDNIWISSCFHGIALYGGGNFSINAFRCYEYEQCALLVSACIDVNLSLFRFHAGDSIKGRLGGIRLQGPTEAFTASQGDITLGVYSLTTADFGSTARGSAPYFNRFSNVFFDSALNQCVFGRSLSHTDFTNCWFASAGHDEAIGYSSAGDYAGIDLDNCSHIRFIGGDVYNNGSFGALLYNTNSRISFNGVDFKRNGFDAPSSRAGIKVLADTDDFIVTNCIFEEDADTTTYKMDLAVEVDTGTSDRYIIADNLLGGCTITDNGSGVNKRVENNY